MWIGQEWHERKQLDERARPAVGQNQRYSGSLFSALMDKVKPNTIDLRVVVLEGIKRPLLCLPIEFACPVLKQLPKVLKVSPLLPSSAWCLIRPSRLTNALLEIRKDLWLDVDREWSDM
jgi:hypothetical protein